MSVCIEILYRLALDIVSALFYLSALYVVTSCCSDATARQNCSLLDPPSPSATSSCNQYYWMEQCDFSYNVVTEIDIGLRKKELGNAYVIKRLLHKLL